MPTPLVTGIHHVTAIAGPAARSLRFYTETLCMRLVKRTVNFDDPFTWHLYYGDAVGSPGTLLTHFPHGRAKPGRHGTAEISDTVLSVAPGSLDAWRERLNARGIEHETEHTLGAERLTLTDPDGMRLALVAEEHPSGRTGADAPSGVASVVIRSPEAPATIDFLTGVLGFERSDTDGDRATLRLGAGRAGERVEIIDDAESPAATMSAGAVHHVAWRAPDDETQARVASALRDAGAAVTPVRDRHYFRSIYFRVPGGVIFEVATDGPGFDIDEPPDTLGSSLMLPPQYEPRRESIAARLDPLHPAPPAEQ